MNTHTPQERSGRGLHAHWVPEMLILTRRGLRSSNGQGEDKGVKSGYTKTVTENTTGVKAGQHRTEALDRAGLGGGGAEGV